MLVDGCFEHVEGDDLVGIAVEDASVCERVTILVLGIGTHLQQTGYLAAANTLSVHPHQVL